MDTKLAMTKQTNEERLVMLRENKVLRKTIDCAAKVFVISMILVYVSDFYFNYIRRENFLKWENKYYKKENAE